MTLPEHLSVTKHCYDQGQEHLYYKIKLSLI